ncbi:GNAT family N-acetyltransferase [Magnetococcus sp. PR-3]|uniref:GNAT family N-acetyltransferase n=1 Tax=Magnetococcus sp. PR-3 TaxID=3120355 RepID=UPI002FCE6868
MQESTPTPESISFELCAPVQEHARQVMDWRNDPVTLTMFYHREPKVWEQFWPEYRDTYFNEAVRPLFALYQGRRVAFVRFCHAPHPQDLAGPCVDISINIDPKQRGRGLATPILQAASTHLRRQGIDAVVAEVRQENSASSRAFAKAGYHPLGATVKTIADTAEQAKIERYVHELVDPFWRKQGVYVIAEAGSNWRMGHAARDLAMGRALIDAAVESGSDAVKFQTYRPESVYVANAGQSNYLAESGIKQDISEIFADLAMPYEMLEDLANYCKKVGIQFLSTGFSEADFKAIDPWVDLHKIASYEISHMRLIDLAAKSGKPLVLSTGASAPEDIAWAVDRYHQQGGRDLCLLQCTAKYPAPLSSVNSAVLPWLRQQYGVSVGLSDHSRDPVAAPVAAVAQGARIIEKHYTLHNALPGPDHSFAVTAEELKIMVTRIREAEEVRGSGVKRVLGEEKELAAFARRGVQALVDIAPGEMLEEGKNVDILRPGNQPLGVHPRQLEKMEGRCAKRAIQAGEGVQAEDWS